MDKERFLEQTQKYADSLAGFEHMEFLYPDFGSICAVLDEKGIEFEMEKNPGHEWVNIVINGGGQELKLNNRTLADVIPGELKEGKAYLV